MKLEMKSSGRALYRAGLLGAWLMWLSGACGGQTTATPVVGSESHFLTRCSDTCDGELTCIAGLCTTSCLAGVDECTELASTAVCTNQSVEPGAVAVCDVSCTSGADCAELGDRHACENGFCRAAAVGSTGTLGAEVCEAYLDQIPPPSELPGVTIVNGTDHTLDIQPLAPQCRQQESLVRVSRVGEADSVIPVNIQGTVCSPRCNDVSAQGWRHEGEGYLDDRDCPGVSCIGAPPAVPIEPGQSILEPARLEWVPERLPRGCASGITTDAVNCFKRIIPPSEMYQLAVFVSDQPECVPPGCTPAEAATAGRWFYEPVTITLLGP